MIGRRYMATKKEWTEYFELINDRQPSAEEVLAAIESGEISFSEKSSPKNKQTITVNKNSFKNYFNWLKESWVHPVNSHYVSGKYYGLITLGIAALTLGIAIWFIYRNTARSIGSAMSPLFGNGFESSSDNVATNIFLPAVLLIAILYLAIVISGFVTKRLVFQESEFSLNETFDYYGRMFSIILLINVFVLLFAMLSSVVLAMSAMYISITIVGFIGTYSVFSSISKTKLDSFYAALIGNVVFGGIFGVIALITITTIGKQVMLSIFS